MPNGQAFNTGSGKTAAAAAAISMPSVPAIAAEGVAAVSKSAAKAATSSNGIASNFDVGRFRMAENASMGTTVNLTVTGALDKEGTARTIIDTLNDSYFRGTGGAGNFVTT